MKNFNIDPIDLETVKNANIIVSNSINVLSHYYYELQKVINPDCFFEVGAFEANFSREMRRRFPNAEVWAFEANPFNYEHYKSSIKDINYLNLAISNTNETIRFYLQDKNLKDNSEIEKVRGNNSILSRNDSTVSYTDVEVESVMLDSFIEENKLIDKKISLWIDVEGANKNVLVGFENYIENSLSILIEVEEKEYWKEQWLREDVCNFLERKNFIPLVRDFEDNHQYNVVFVHKTVFKDSSIQHKIMDWINSYFNHLQLEIAD